jgi:hypothetical protein
MGLDFDSHPTSPAEGVVGTPTAGWRDPAATLALAQAAYYIPTGLWPIVHPQSFQRVTGPKTDVWLVKTVGALVSVIGGVLGVAGWRRRVTPEVALLGAGSALALAAIDTVYVARGRIAPIYLADAVGELGLAAAWAGACAMSDGPQEEDRPW